MCIPSSSSAVSETTLVAFFFVAFILKVGTDDVLAVAVGIAEVMASFSETKMPLIILVAA